MHGAMGPFLRIRTHAADAAATLIAMAICLPYRALSLALAASVLPLVAARTAAARPIISGDILRVCR